MTDALLMRSCASCFGLFWICPNHDRGHAYCGDACRKTVRKRSLQRARAKYQSSPEGRADQRDRMRLRRLVGRRRVMDQRSEKLAVSVTVVAPEHARDSTVESGDVSGRENDDRIDNRGDSPGSGKSPNSSALPPSVPTSSGTETTDPLVATRVARATRNTGGLSVNALGRCIVCGRIGDYCVIGDNLRTTRLRRQSVARGTGGGSPQSHCRP